MLLLLYFAYVNMQVLYLLQGSTFAKCLKVVYVKMQTSWNDVSRELFHTTSRHLSQMKPFGLPIFGGLQVPCGGAVASWLVRSTTERALRVRSLAGDIALCS